MPNQKLLDHYKHLNNQFNSYIHSYDRSDFRVSWTKRPHIFDQVHPKILESTVSFVDLYQPEKKSDYSIFSVFETVSFRVPWPEWSHPFLTMPTQ